MAERHRLIRRPPADVWAVLSDGRRYADWVVGTHASWEDDGGWPREGSALKYQLKFGPWTYTGRTIVRILEPGRRLELEALSGKAGSARIAIEVKPWGEDTLVIVDEHPLRGPAATFHTAAFDALLQLRHRNMLSRLAHVVESGHPVESGHAVESGEGQLP